jgi:hypothetical protein
LFDNKSEGRYTIVLSDLAGRTMQTKTVAVSAGVQTEKVNLNGHLAKGVYLVKVLDENKSIIINEKVVIQ